MSSPFTLIVGEPAKRLGLRRSSLSISRTSIEPGSSPLSTIAAFRSASALSHEGHSLHHRNSTSAPRTCASAAEDARLLLLELGLAEGAGVTQLRQALELGDRVAAAGCRRRLGWGAGGRRGRPAGRTSPRSGERAAWSQSIAIFDWSEASTRIGSVTPGPICAAAGTMYWLATLYGSRPGTCTSRSMSRLNFIAPRAGVPMPTITP